MKILFKKALSLMMCLYVLFSAGVWSFAEDSQEEPIEWIEIYTYEDLDDVRYDLTKNYKLMNDIDMTEFVKPGGDYDFFGQGWNPIGSKDVYGQTDFSGIFDGNGYTISGLRMNVTKFPSGTGEKVYFGLFSSVSGTVKNLSISGEISIVDTRKSNNLGGISALLESSGVIDNCINLVKMSVNSDSQNTGSSISNKLGGIVGESLGTISNCCNVADLHAFAKGSYYSNVSYTNHNYMGGINGYTQNYSNYGRIFNCINTGNISGESYSYTNNSYTGSTTFSCGISYASKEIYNCFNCGSVSSNRSNYGIAAYAYVYGTFKNCYNVGAVTGGGYAISSAKSTNCYYLRGTGTTSEGATERTEAQMMRQITFQDWDFENVWTMEGRDDYFYPELRDVALIMPDDINRTPIEGTVSIDGEIGVGNTLTANIGSVTPENATVFYSWTIDGEQVGDAESYQIKESDIRKTITLAVSGTGDFRGKLTAELLLEKAHVHVEETIHAVDPTCMQTGLTEGKKCSECGEILVAQQEVAALGHDYNAVVTAPTCTQAGYTTYTCTRCTDTYISDIVSALDHDYTAVVTDPTCTQAGYTTYTCTRCTDTYISDRVSALGHNYNAVITNPNCTEAGYTTHTCSRCGDTYTSDTKSALGHDYNAVVTNPTCTEAGYTTHTCSRCGDTYTSDTESALGHDYTAVATNPTCTEAGYTTHTCSRCSDSYVDGESSALGHTEPDSNGNCTRCGAHIKDVVNPDACPYCGQVHDGIFGRIVAFFHKVIYFIDQLF